MIHFKIATPERVMLDVEVESLTLPTQMGEITVLPNHIPLVANLLAGEIKYRQAGQEKFFAVSGGVIEVKKNNEVVVLADSAEFGHEIDEAQAEKARDAAKKLMQETVTNEEKFADARAMLERNLARLKVARKHRTHTHKNLESESLNE
jgi:F-type H+-transporting ATPase subunit epsilon